MKQNYVMPVGVDDFRQVREEYYYVDKTDFIKALIDGHSKVTLITRPRRFGKTLAMSMLTTSLPWRTQALTEICSKVAKLKQLVKNT